MAEAEGSTTVAVIATGADADRVPDHCVVVTSVATAPAGAPIVAFGDPAVATDPRVTHVVRPGMPDELLLPLIEALASGTCAELQHFPSDTPAHARRAQR